MCTDESECGLWVATALPVRSCRKSVPPRRGARGEDEPGHRRRVWEPVRERPTIGNRRECKVTSRALLSGFKHRACGHVLARITYLSQIFIQGNSSHDTDDYLINFPFIFVVCALEAAEVAKAMGVK